VLVFFKEGFVLLAVPKTGTTALAGALAPRAAMVLRDPPHLKHSTIFRYRRFIEPFFEKAGGKRLETVAVVREPISWLSSWYRYRGRAALDGHPNSTAKLTFDDFVDEYCRGKPAPFADVGSQAKFVSDQDDNIAVDHLFRYESDGALMAFLGARLGGDLSLPRLNVSPERETPLSPPVEEKLRRKRAAEFEIWQAARP